MTAQLKQRPDPAVVLSKALLNASKQLTLKQDELGKVIGVHRTAITRLKQNLDLSPDSKQGELALLLIRAARALFALTGGDQAWIKHFMRSPLEQRMMGLWLWLVGCWLVAGSPNLSN